MTFMFDSLDTAKNNLVALYSGTPGILPGIRIFVKDTQEFLEYNGTDWVSFEPDATFEGEMPTVSRSIGSLPLSVGGQFYYEHVTPLPPLPPSSTSPVDD